MRESKYTMRKPLFCLLLLWMTRTVSAQDRLSTLAEFENARKTNALTRINNIDAVNDGSNIGICNIAELNMFSALSADGTRTAATFPLVWQGMAAIAMAMEHLNTGDGTVVEEVAGLNNSCNIRFTVDHIDTAGQESEAVDHLINLFNSELPPCAFLGSFRSQVSIPTAILTGVKGYPQVSALSGAPQLNDKTQYPLFARVRPSSDEFGEPFLDYLYNHLNVRHLAVAYTDNTIGLAFMAGVRSAQSRFLGMEVVGVAFPANTSPEDYAAAVAALKQTEYHYFFGIISHHQFEPLLMEAYRQGIAGDGVHQWILSNPSAILITYAGKSFAPEDPMTKIGLGMLSYEAVMSHPGTGRYDQFLQEWKKIGNSPSDMEYLRTKIPQHPDDPSYQPILDESSFESLHSLTSGLYDAAILLGLSACKMAGGFNFTGEDHFQNILNTKFMGATGLVELNPITGSRVATTSFFSISNNLPEQGSDGNYTFQNTEVAMFKARSWDTSQPLIFNDGTQNIPGDLPPASLDNNYIGTPLRAVGLAMSGVIILSSLLCSMWAYYYRKSRVVLASQPYFLHILCLGTCLLGTAIIPISFDEEITSNLDASCRVFPWLCCLGWCISFSAIFTKTMRVNRIFYQPTFNRVKVTLTDIMKPLTVLTFLNVLLLVLWTTLSPLSWERVTIEEDRFGRLTETKGQCQSDQTLAFIIPLVCVNIGVLALALYQAYVTRNVSVEFAESDYIARAMSLTLVVAFMAIPITVIAEDDTRAYFFVASAFIFVVAMSLLGFIFLPKIIFQNQKARQTKNGKSQSSTGSSQRMRSRIETKANSVEEDVSILPVPADAHPNTTSSNIDNSGNSSSHRRAENVRSTAELPDKEFEDDSEGARVLQHPKHQRDLEVQNALLREENERLLRRFRENSDDPPSPES